MSASEKTIFKKILDGEIPADVVYQDEHCMAFRDVAPQAPTHVLIIPRKEIRSLDDLSDDDEKLIGHLMMTIHRLARQLEVNDAYRVISNCGEGAGQSVHHLHFHLLAGRAMSWPPG